MGVYDSLATRAAELIKKFGKEMTLRSASSEDTYDPVEGVVTPGASGVSDVKFFGVKIAPTTEYTQSIAEGSVQSSDMLIYMQPSVRYPNLEDVILIDYPEVSEVWQIVNVREEKPADKTLLYVVQVRP